MTYRADLPEEEVQTEKNMQGETRRIISKARSKGTVVSTVAMMEAKARDSMKESARKTGSQFTIIENDGEAREVKPD